MLDGHAEDGEFVKFSVHSRAHGDQGGQFRNVRVHLITSTLLNLAVVLPAKQNLTKV